ncbi:hypothetical protein RHGRI_028627 [Rhododendron griersonianum]|uniref:Sulfotransferase n=1 Tax=Rhododendron griersonianum TaxID=479676 RepID=A0AAV6IJX0_9ERIC|nr:hypothetical protein RHGRI_028627 [Rhododendron griersonianum]
MIDPFALISLELSTAYPHLVMATSKSPNTSSSSSSSLASFDELPRETWWENVDLYKCDGFWYGLPYLVAAMEAQSSFKDRDDDVLLASSTKTGTTWLKALIPCIMDPYARLVNDDDDGMPSPRLFRTHLPYTKLPESIKSPGNSKIVYITRNPKDTFVSLWHFLNSIRTVEQGPLPLIQMFDKFCNGVHAFGPFHDHVLEYWKESVKRPEKILFLKYEELKRDPRGEVKKLALFLGRPFGKEEEVDKVLWRCSFERLKSLEVNRNGVDPWAGFPKTAYFRLGVVGDWKNSLTEEMKERLDQITSKKMEGSGLDL